jgi:hypothetical protein
MYIYGVEPDIRDDLIGKMKRAALLDLPGMVHAGTPPTPDRQTYKPADPLPFELRMLDTALEDACRLLRIEVRGVINSGKDGINKLEGDKPSVCTLIPLQTMSMSSHFVCFSTDCICRFVANLLFEAVATMSRAFLHPTVL